MTGNEQPIVLYKVFEVTVKGNADAADRAALYQQKLNDALAAPGLKDFVTGAKLTADANGVYTTSNDIQFPTTRDLKIDGKYTPVVITSSDPGVIEAPTTPNSARVWVYRPLPGEAAKTVTLTMKILDRPNGPQPGDDLSAMRVLASKEIKVTVQPLTQDEIDAEIALMERVKVKVNYWNGIRNANVERDNVTTDLHAFQECYLNDNGELTWVYDREDLKNHGIVPVPLDNWYDQQIWRLFRSSNAGVVAHENLLVTRQGDSKAVTITSYLSSETLGKYAEKYPQNADFQKLYKQPVTIDLVVTGTQYAQGNNEGRVQAATRAGAVRPTVTVSFSLSGRGMGFTESNLEYAEGSTVYDVFSDLLAEHRYTCKRRGSYIAAITSNSGVTLEEFDEGKNSGWMYRVNGELVGRYMSAQGLNDGDRIELYFTSDWTSEPGAEGWQQPDRIETIVNADGSVKASPFTRVYIDAEETLFDVGQLYTVLRQAVIDKLSIAGVLLPDWSLGDYISQTQAAAVLGVETDTVELQELSGFALSLKGLKKTSPSGARDGYRYYQFPAAADGTTLVLGYSTDALFSKTTPIHVLLTIPDHNVHIQLTGTVTAAKTVLSPPASRMNDGDIATLAQIRQSLEAIWKMIQSATQTTN